jgi:DNA-binding HxlR family transcriptional regulator
MQYGDKHHIRAVVKITSSKWMLPVLHVLSDGTKRYHEIHLELPGITQKVLTDMLHRLEGYGLISREAYPTVPPKVEYSLTALGESFALAYVPVIDWAKSNLEELSKSIELYDLAS